MNMKKIAITMMASMTLVGSVYAAKPGVYIGAGAGYSSLDNFSDATKKQEGGVAGTLFAGYNFNPYMGIEAGYRAYHQTTYELDSYNAITVDYKYDVVDVVGKGYWPMMGEDSKFNFYALLGVAYVHARANLEYENRSYGSESNDAYLAIAGLGGSYDINSQFTTSLEYVTINDKDADSDNLAIPQSNMVTLNLIVNLM